jgi:signal transduction histidine kinase
MLVAYARLRHERGDTVVYGVEVDQARFREELRRAFDDPVLLPRSLTRGAPNSSLLAIRVLGVGEELLFASTERATPAIYADQALPERVSGVVVRASVLPEAAERLIIGGMPGDRTPVLLLLFGLAACLMVLSVSLFRKENELARLRSDFVASVSHELRTPVAQIRLFVETLRLGRVSNDAQREWAFERIERETLRLGGLVDKILHFNRIERGVVPAHGTPVDVGEGVEDATTSFDALLPTGKARLALASTEGLLAPVHPDSLRQVVLNLLENAVKYGADGQTIRVCVDRRDGFARIAVEDEGPGVPTAERRLIWEPFRRGAAAVGSATAGGGIGLSVVRQIVRAHGGRAWVEDAKRGGARFVVELPALRVAGGGAGAQAGRRGAPAGAA